MKIEFDLGKLEKVSKVVADIKVEHQNTTEEEDSVEEPFEESFAKEQGCEFNGLTYRGTYLGGKWNFDLWTHFVCKPPQLSDLLP